ncbi:MAG: NADP-dependent malic enzyme, partial [Candidatus Micrarchaeota archaeon]|nr:NADP-dependent malic enzyme [Candidatus Micrarchaeota archaeon]
EDIETPKVLRIVERLTRELDIPVFHDDSKGVAVVTLAGLINALKLAGKGMDSRIVIDGAGSAGYGIVELFHAYGLRNMVVLDSKGIIYSGRHGSNEFKEKMAGMTKGSGPGSLADAVKGADVLIGVSTKGSFDGNLIRTMADKPIVFALTNPDPEISYEDAKSAGAFIVATGRSDTPNQINNSLVFPGVMRGLLDVRAKAVSDGMLLKAATTIARLVGKELSQEKIVPTMADTKSSYKVAANVAHAVAHQAIAEGLARTTMTADQVKKHLKEQMRVYSRFEKRIPK